MVDDWENTLTIADFDTEEDHIFILDENYGFIKFWLWGDEVTDLSWYTPTYINNADFVAMTAIMIDDEYYFTFITTTKLYEYKIMDIDKDDITDFTKMYEQEL